MAQVSKKNAVLRSDELSSAGVRLPFVCINKLQADKTLAMSEREKRWAAKPRRNAVQEILNTTNNKPKENKKIKKEKKM